MEQKNEDSHIGSIFLLLSFLISIGLVGTADSGGSMLNLLWIVPMAIINFIIIEREMY